MKKPGKSASLPEIQKPPDQVAKLNPVRYRLSFPLLAVYGDTRHSLWSIRKIPRNALEKRSAEAERLKEVVLERTFKAWDQAERERVLTGLRDGSLENFCRWVRLYGPRGLWLALSEPEILRLVEGWWIDGALLGDDAPRERIGAMLGAVATQELGNDTKFSPEEQQRKKSGHDRQTKHDTRALQYCNRMWNTYTEETRGVKDLLTLREIGHTIARAECGRGGDSKRYGIRLFLQKVKHALKIGTVVKIPR